MRPPYSYRGDPEVGAFPDDRPIIIFDGYCALCSGWAQFVLRHDARGVYRLVAAQTQLGARFTSITVSIRRTTRPIS
jgi:predicted DCC family thiol-disulfide oxidoreductase YuxK